MRFRLLLSTLAVCLLVALASALIVQAQTQSLNERNSAWETRSVIGLPDDDDEGDDEGDDEASDCPPYPAPVAATGQTRCWDYVYSCCCWTSQYQDCWPTNLTYDYAVSRCPFGFDCELTFHETDCLGSGQDGDYRRGVSVEPRFTDNLDGTVTDNLTGLTWFRHANCFGFQSILGAFDAVDQVANGNCGLNDGSVAGDWRVPNARELMSLMDFGTEDGLPVGHLFFEVPGGVGQDAERYWTSTMVVYNEPNLPFERGAMTVNFWRHHLVASGVAWPLGGEASHLVWPVRGPE